MPLQNDDFIFSSDIQKWINSRYRQYQRKYCPFCQQTKYIDAFAPVTKTYVKADGTISEYNLRRNKCRHCTWGNSRYIKKKSTINLLAISV